MSAKSWSRSQKLAFWAIVVPAAVAVGGTIIAHHNKPAAAPPVATTVPQVSNATPVSPLPKTQEAPRFRQTVKSKVAGDQNVTGNNIAGNGNVTGNNNKSNVQVTAPNGIAIGGDNNGTATVTNYNGIFPPPNVVPTISICVSRSQAENNNQVILKMKTDTPISEPAWWFLFDGPVIDAVADADPKPFGYAHAHPPQNQRPYDWQNAVGITVTSIGGLFSQQPWRPEMPITVTVTSKGFVNLLEIHGRSLNQPIDERLLYQCN